MGTVDDMEKWGSYRPHEHLSIPNMMNAALLVVALMPSIFFTFLWYTECDSKGDERYDLDFWTSHCSLALYQPVYMVNILFFINISVGFWLIGLIQRSFWLIDPYWTILPPLMAHFYHLNPRANSNAMRSKVSLVLIWIWSIRLTYSYFRREEFKFGQREDWRYTKMAEDNPRIWWILSFLAVGVAQQPMLIGITLPASSIHSSNAPFSVLDFVATFTCLFGLTLAYVADSQLYEFMRNNDTLERDGKKKLLVLDSGLWRHSRHPNYCGETLWWLGYSLFGVSVGQAWVLCGWLLNTAVLIQVTMMTEERMKTNRTGVRLEAFISYQKRTACWIPRPTDLQFH